MLRLNVPDKYAMERTGHSTNNMLKNVYQHTMDDKAVAVADAVDGFFESEFHLQFICKSRVLTEDNLQISQVMRKQVSQKALANTRKTPQPLRLRGFFIGGGGGSRTRVRKHFNRTFSGRSQDLNIPSAQGHLTDLTLW